MDALSHLSKFICIGIRSLSRYKLWFNNIFTCVRIRTSYRKPRESFFYFPSFLYYSFPQCLLHSRSRHQISEYQMKQTQVDRKWFFHDRIANNNTICMWMWIEWARENVSQRYILTCEETNRKKRRWGRWIRWIFGMKPVCFFFFFVLQILLRYTTGAL